MRRSARHKDKQRARLAMAIRHLWAPGVRDVYPVLPDYDWQACQRLARQILKAREHDWQAADRRKARDLAEWLSRLRNTVDDLHQRLTKSAAQQPFATPTELYQDIVSLEDEFESVGWDLRERTLSVRTEPIVFQGLRLGPFEIRLAWGDAGEQHYECLALEPCYSAIDDSVTHPHVQDGQLCEGQGSNAIRQALDAGRLLDFFIMVRCLLRTHNAGSAYVALDRWSGTPCPDCDASMSEYSERQCNDCERTVCRDCLEDCRSCDKGCCVECLTSCGDCDHYVCSRCHRRCRRCSQLYCQNCLNGEECESCKKETAGPVADSAADAQATV